MCFFTFGTSILLISICCTGCIYCLCKFYSLSTIWISASQFTRFCKMIPQISCCDPTCFHITTRIKVIPLGIDFFPFVCWIGTICILIPPASVVFLPTSGCLCLPWNVDSIRIHIIDATVNPFICCHCSTGLQIIPNITALQPSGSHVSTGIQIIPVSTNFLPTSLHCSTGVKIVPGISKL